MKNITILFLALSTITASFAQTKDELIEELFIVSNIKAQFEEMFQTVISSYGDDKSEDLIEILKTHCTWESWKDIHTKTMNECYTKEEIESVIKLYEDPDFKELMQKSVAYAILNKKAGDQWLKEISPKISDAIQKLPRDEKPPTRATVWNSWNDKQKWNFVDGYKQGIAFASRHYWGDLESQTSNASALTEKKANEQIILSTYTVKLCRAVSEFYEDPENENIPHINALHFVDLRIEGKDIFELLEKAQRVFNKSEPGNREVREKAGEIE